MRVARRRLRSDVSVERALLLLDARARDRGLPPPAALTGQWFSARAVLVPSLPAHAVTDPDVAFAAVTDLPPMSATASNTVDGAVGGGWVGYLSYQLTDPTGRKTPLPNAVWGWTDTVLVRDADGRWWFEALVPPGSPEPAELAAELEGLLRHGEPDPKGWTPTRLHRPPEAEHAAAVRACVDAIAAGELFQANVCSRFTALFDGQPAELFAEGVRRLRPRRAAYLAGSWGTVASLSPELFLARHGRRVRSTPIKGTLPRRGPADAPLAIRLRRSTKDVAENVMITDLVRNDLGQVCRTGSVWVPELLAVTPAPGVWHLESTVEGELAEGRTDADLLRAAFPPGSVTGAPKLRALDLIAELEHVPRGVYTGAVGMVSPVAGLELNVAIRTFELHGTSLALGVGGGITADSDPAAEWRECLHKSAPLDALLAEPPTP
ncbi:para-aminobenzoate synthetase component 1 [Amycolatopsis arida]|uniref:Para-aminobenzoate synthetase component 1 n=1 Tax=Amycolatopsis arida TaxID=587909 RepID=A0A1I5Q498_9PSEU|nr:aminodeoxychorismate synthase component I [Amycolatopsis arida]TDX98711.1 para-aminobenzoate synthetase component 1 [Amycolatopsis arida]SFP41017.1 para-aminobenzoate synthetase component 1 [Amycolatopsis arida]